MQDQFAFRRSGSTTCALTYCLHHITLLLETNSYVRALPIDLSKVFDIVNHEILIPKMLALGMPDNAEAFSTYIAICRSIIQGSGF